MRTINVLKSLYDSSLLLFTKYFVASWGVGPQPCMRKTFWYRETIYETVREATAQEVGAGEATGSVAGEEEEEEALPGTSRGRGAASSEV